MMLMALLTSTTIFNQFQNFGEVDKMSNSELSALTLIILILPLEDAIKFLGVGESLLTTKLTPFTCNGETYVQLTL